VYIKHVVYISIYRYVNWRGARAIVRHLCERTSCALAFANARDSAPRHPRCDLRGAREQGAGGEAVGPRIIPTQARDPSVDSTSA
jgi:hypothetical protein